MTKKQRKQPVKSKKQPTKNGKKTKSQPTSKQAPNNAYKISITKRPDFELDDAIAWMDSNCKGKRWHKMFKKNFVFSFETVDDAFKFKLYYERAQLKFAFGANGFVNPD